MVNLVVRHTSQIPGPTNPRAKESPMINTRLGSPKGLNRSIPSPIHVGYNRSSGRPVSPLTTSESMFGTIIQEPNPVSDSHDSSSRRRRLAPLSSRDESLTNAELICDYDHDVTLLYELLESSQWDQARLRCRTHPEEVQTWIVRRDANGIIRWKLLPLHAAVIFQAPPSVLDAMLKEYAVAAGKKDDQGMLPLHLAFRHKQEESILVMLLRQYPQAVFIKDSRDRIPIEHGSDSEFSTNLIQVYAEACSTCQSQSPRHVIPDPSPAYEAEMEAMKQKYEDRMNTYEDRMNTLLREHEQEMRDLKLKMEQDQHLLRTKHNQEMDELRDLLSREVASNQRTRQLELENEEMQNSLAQATKESQALRALLRDEKAYQEEMKDHVRKALTDQKTLHAVCLQQQEQLEESQKLREQLLRSLLAKDDGKVVRSSREICQLSDSIQLRTKQILSRLIDDPEDPPNVEAVNNQLTTLAEIDEYDVHETEGWGVEGDHHPDDISAITEDHF